ncbi:MAG: hypothetical protein WCT46_03105 [Candidatus Gracilibacteria bacterium]
MAKVEKKSDLKKQAVLLLAMNPFLDVEKKHEWLRKIETMKSADLKKLISILGTSKQDFHDLLSRALKMDKDGVLSAKLAQYIKSTDKEIVEVAHEKEEDEAEVMLSNNLNNI